MSTQEQSPMTGEPLPVSIARNGFTPAQAKDFLAHYKYEEVLKAGDVATSNLTQYAREIAETFRSM